MSSAYFARTLFHDSKGFLLGRGGGAPHPHTWSQTPVFLGLKYDKQLGSDRSRSSSIAWQKKTFLFSFNVSLSNLNAHFSVTKSFGIY